MDWIIESDKNNGYPYHAELKDIYFEPVKSSPYPSELFILSGKGAYPKLQRLNFLSRIVLLPQYPTVLFRSHKNTSAVNVRSKIHALFLDFTQLGK